MTRTTYIVLAIVGLIVLAGVVGPPPGKSTKSQTHATPAVTTTAVAPVAAPAAPPAEQNSPSGNACHGVETSACYEQQQEEESATSAVLKHRQAEQTASQLEAIAQAQGENE